MNNKEEAEKMWRMESLKAFAPASYQDGISDFKAALIQAVDKRISDNPFGEQYEMGLRKAIDLINETKPL